MTALNVHEGFKQDTSDLLSLEIEIAACSLKGASGESRALRTGNAQLQMLFALPGKESRVAETQQLLRVTKQTTE